MCGIVGSFVSSKTAALKTRILRGCKVLFHRGPDDKGLVIIETDGGKVALGHTRLSIIDLSSAGHQPMQCVSKRFSLVFNGEIYNYKELRNELSNLGYKFNSNSDSEVLLVAWQEWGKKCVHKLRGMFSFVIFDSFQQILFCVRDPFGIKPFFYKNDESGFHFASEIRGIKELVDCKLDINFQRAYNYLVYGRYDDGEDTFFKDVFHLLPGHIMEVDCSQDSLKNPTPSRLCLERWWWPSIQERNDLSFTDAAEILKDMFLANVRLHMRSDVPLGAALSGGIDSSALVCVMRHLEPEMPINTYSYIAKGTPFDEEIWVNLINSEIGAFENKIFISPSEIIEGLPTVIEAQGEPILSPSVYSQFKVFECVKKTGITVTLDGQGADELLAGYDSYVGARLHSLATLVKIPQIISFLLNWKKKKTNSVGFALAHFLDNLSNPFIDRMLYTFHKSSTPPWLENRQVYEAGVNVGRPPRPQPYSDFKSRRLMEKLRFSLTGFGLSSLLRHADRNSMYWSVESRVPFLTHDMAEFLLSLPESYLFSNDAESKCVFRSAMRGIVPRQILSRKDKVGFVSPESSIRENLSYELKERNDTKFFKKDKLETLKSDEMWRLLNFSIWCEKNNF